MAFGVGYLARGYLTSEASNLSVAKPETLIFLRVLASNSQHRIHISVLLGLTSALHRLHHPSTRKRKARIKDKASGSIYQGKRQSEQLHSFRSPARAISEIISPDPLTSLCGTKPFGHTELRSDLIGKITKVSFTHSVILVDSEARNLFRLSTPSFDTTTDSVIKKNVKWTNNSTKGILLITKVPQPISTTNIPLSDGSAISGFRVSSN
jgi:hypothetical protein